MTMAYIVSEHYYDFQEIYGVFRLESDARNFLIQLYLTKSRNNVSNDKIVRNCFTNQGLYSIEPIELI